MTTTQGSGYNPSYGDPKLWVGIDSDPGKIQSSVTDLTLSDPHHCAGSLEIQGSGPAPKIISFLVDFYSCKFDDH